jgi:hypothetical protein
MAKQFGSGEIFEELDFEFFFIFLLLVFLMRTSLSRKMRANELTDCVRLNDT